MTSTLDVDVLFDPAPSRARKQALSIKRRKDVNLPKLRYWNYDPCRHHAEPDPACEYRACGGQPFKHQRVGVTWLYAAQKGILGDVTGLGKTVEVLATVALLKERGELPNGALIVAQNGAVEDPWMMDTARFAPGLTAVAGVGSRAPRRELYAGAWDVLVIGYMMFLRDFPLLRELPWDLVVADDVQPLLHNQTETAKRYNILAESASRVINLNATPYNINLLDLYNLSLSCGGYSDFGTEKEFVNRYFRIEHIKALTPSGRTTMVPKVTGYKNMREFKSKFGPYFLRRDYADVEDDVAIPKVAPAENVWLELHQRQREEYRKLQTGIVAKLLDGDTETKRKVNPLTAFGYGAQICSGLTNLGHDDVRGETSVKLDWFEQQITGQWANEKVVVFSQYKGTIRAMHERLRSHGIGDAIIWGDTPGDSKRKMQLRKEEQRRFWEDPNCRVAVGTTAMERSLNLQVSRIVLNLDLLLNPQRMVQILGRIRRVGSSHKRVYPISLLIKDSQEERYLPILKRRAAVADYVFEGKNPLFEQLDPVELLHLIQP